MATGPAAPAEGATPRRDAIGSRRSLRTAFETYPALGPVLPALGYGAAQMVDLRATIEAVPCEIILLGTPVDLGRALGLSRPLVRVRYDVEEVGLIVMARASGRVGTRSLLGNWGIVFAGNLAGAVPTAFLVYLGGTYRLGGGAFGVAALGIAAGKLQLGFVQAVALGILCNVLVCLAVWLTLSARSTADRILAIVPPISAFVAAGLEHSIANMYFLPIGWLVATLDPGFVGAHGLDREAHALTWTGFLVRNLLPVTVGNLIGGVLLVGLVYWFVYLRPRAA